MGFWTHWIERFVEVFLHRRLRTIFLYNKLWPSEVSIFFCFEFFLFSKTIVLSFGFNRNNGLREADLNDYGPRKN